MSATPTELAGRAHEAIREAVHATLHGGGWDYPADVYETLGQLDQMAVSLGQLLTQASGWLAKENHLGRVGVDARGEGTLVEELTLAHLHLEDATDMARELHVRLGRAHSATSRLTGTSGGD